jgi:hypothetical protein
MRTSVSAVAEEIPVVEPVQLADLVPVVHPVPEPRGFWGTIVLIFRGIESVWEWCFGFACLLVFLAVLAALPIVQFLSLGYLLEASGRVARSGRLRDGFIGVRVAARAGGFVLGTWLVLLPLRLVSSLWLSAQLIEPDGSIARGWDIALNFLTILALIHIALAWAAGGKLRHFLFPFANPILIALHIWRGGFWTSCRDGVWEFFVSLRLPYYFWLGWRGFWGAFLWLAGPITLLAVGRKVPLLGFVGAVALVIVLLYVPFLQLRFVLHNRFRTFLEVGRVRQLFRRAPIALAFSFFITLLFAVPLYLLKIEMIPREAAWLPSLVFILFMFPARLLTGWAFSRALRRERPRHWFFRWTSRLFMLGITLVYVVIVYFSQFAAWEGIGSLYEQHAFMLPVPFLSM